LKAAEAAALQQAGATAKAETGKPQTAKGQGSQQIPSFN
jgi:hypothetical protein